MNKKSVMRALCALAFAGGAMAQTTDPKVTISVSAVGTQVTGSQTNTQGTPEKTYAAYIVKFVNGGGSELRQTMFTLTASGTTGVTAPLIQDSAINLDLPAQCSVPSGGAAVVTCDFRSLVLPPGYTTQFSVIVSAPQFNSAPPADNQSISLKMEGQFREGKSTSASPNSLGYTSSSASHSVVKLAINTVDSVVVKTGGKLFTGAKGIPSGTDPHSTEVNFASLDSINYDLVNITERAVTGARATTCAGDRYFRTCYETELSATGVVYTSPGKYLTETIRAHSANILKPASQMASLIWYYTPTGESAAVPIGQCASATTPSGTGVPCQVGPGICYTKQTAPSADLIGVCVWTFINTRNGLIRPML